MTELTKEQIQRLYMVFDFEDCEEIVSARYGDDGWWEIDYIDSKNNINGCYKPYFEKNEDDEIKKDFILNGFKVEREKL